MKLIIEDDEGRRTVIPLFRDELTIGRADENVVRLSDKDVSRKHARLVRRRGQMYVEDLSSLTGVRVNGQRIHGRRPVHAGDLIEIGRYDLIVESSPGDVPAEKPPEEVTTPIVHGRDATRADIHEQAARRVFRIAMLVLAALLAAAVVAVLWLRSLRGGP
jgi:pSer/pThr/pTyr-binding forkhead associated (FHA) protein